MAAQLGDLALKVWQQQDTPITWRGGVMATVPKSGPQDMCESHSGVLTASTMGKAYASKRAFALSCAEGTWLSV